MVVDGFLMAFYGFLMCLMVFYEFLLVFIVFFLQGTTYRALPVDCVQNLRES